MLRPLSRALACTILAFCLFFAFRTPTFAAHAAGMSLLGGLNVCGENSPNATRINLLGTVEFRGILKNTPQWERVVAEERKKSSLDNPTGLAASWPATREAIKGLKLLEQINIVNKFFNRSPYRLDVDIYGIRNYWATPSEFMKNFGDCKDYAIIKYFALKQLGVDPNSMRIVVLTDAIRNLEHAVMAVYHEGNAYILDSSNNLVLPHTQLTHYKPQFSVNEKYRWIHMPIHAFAAPEAKRLSGKPRGIILAFAASASEGGGKP